MPPLDDRRRRLVRIGMPWAREAARDLAIEDAAAVFMLRLCELASSYDPRGGLRWPIYARTGLSWHRSNVIRRLSARKRRRRIPLRLVEPSICDPEPSGVLEMLENLPPEQRQAVILTVIEGRSLAEAARIMGLGRRTVAKLQKEALSTMKGKADG